MRNVVYFNEEYKANAQEHAEEMRDLDAANKICDRIEQASFALCWLVTVIAVAVIVIVAVV